MKDSVQVAENVRLELPVTPARLARVLLATSCAFFAVSMVLGVAMLHDRLEHSSLVRYLYLDEEQTIPSWFSSCLLLLAAALAFGAYCKRGAHTRAWCGLGLLLVAMSADEQVQAHEHIGDKLQDILHTKGLLFFAFVIPGTAVVLIAAFLFAPLVRSLDRRVRIPLLVAAVMYFGATLGLEAVGGAITDSVGQKNLGYVVEANVEELLELVGVSLLVYALATHLALESER